MTHRLFTSMGCRMMPIDELQKATIFSKQRWELVERKQKIRILKAIEKEISLDLGLKPVPHLVISKDTKVLGEYRSYRNTLMLSELMAIEGKRILVRAPEENHILAKGLRTTNPNSNIDTLFTICHELEHAAQHQRVRGKIAWQAGDDRDGIEVNLQQKVEGRILPYIKGNADATNAYELYQLQPVEYDANQSAMIEIHNLIEKYADCCSVNDIEESKSKIQGIQNKLNSTARMAKVYRSDNIVRDISHCLQNLFTGRRYPVPSDLMRDVENACRASYRYICSEQYIQREAFLKKEINRELAEQECER